MIMKRSTRSWFLLALLLLPVRSLLQGSRPALPPLTVLTYHRISDRILPGDGGRSLPVDRFEEQLDYLRAAGFTTLGCDELLEIRAGTRPCPERPVCLTFDDGYDDNALEAYPLIATRGMKAIFFPVSGSMGRPGHMTWRLLKRLKPAHVSVGSHTESHPDLRLLGAERLRQELVASRDELETALGRPVRCFAYPGGAHDDRVVEATRAAGYELAFTTLPGRNGWDDDPLRLKRRTVGRHHGLADLARWLDGPTPESLGLGLPLERAECLPPAHLAPWPLARRPC